MTRKVTLFAGLMIPRLVLNQLHSSANQDFRRKSNPTQLLLAGSDEVGIDISCQSIGINRKKLKQFFQAPALGFSTVNISLIVKSHSVHLSFVMKSIHSEKE
jgi:hypothetical protein